MIQDITRQPQPGLIGGMVDLGRDLLTVTANMVRSNQADIQEGETSAEQGQNYDPAIVSLSETLTADRPATATAQTIPWMLLAVAVIAFVVIARMK